MTDGVGKPLTLQTSVTSLVLLIASKVVPIGTDTGLVVAQVLFSLEVSILGSSGSAGNINGVLLPLTESLIRRVSCIALLMTSTQQS